MTGLTFTPQNVELAFRLLVAAFLGAAVGLERDMHGRSAGLRTHAMVSLGAAVFTILSYIVAGALDWSGEAASASAYDPGRIAAQIVTGIGFLGAGTILKSRFSIRGLTTASCLWLAAAIGMCCGVGLYSLAVFSTALALLFLIGVSRLERYLPRERNHELTVWLKGREGVQEVRKSVRRCGMVILSDSLSFSTDTSVTKLRLSLRRRESDHDKDGGNEVFACLEASGIAIERLDWDPVDE
jgi:putative Mg2+ transporter-C (MgtC) family protein